jgi:hypothetical protein
MTTTGVFPAIWRGETVSGELDFPQEMKLKSKTAPAKPTK